MSDLDNMPFKFFTKDIVGKPPTRVGDTFKVAAFFGYKNVPFTATSIILLENTTMVFGTLNHQ